MTSSLAIETGLGNTLHHRVLSKGFPTPDSAIVVKRPKQKLPLGIPESLSKCKLESSDDPRRSCEVVLNLHECPSIQLFAEHSCANHYVDVQGSSSLEIRIRPENDLTNVQIEHDLKVLQFNLTLLPNDRLVAQDSGNIYLILSAPTPAKDAPTGKWLVKVAQSNVCGLSVTNDSETSAVVALAREHLDRGGRPKNLAILSPSVCQLEKIAELLGKSGKGIAFRTPYNILGEQWGTVIITCASDSLVGHESDWADPRLFYTMIRVGIQKAIIYGHRSFIGNHPLLRHLQQSENSSH